MKFNALPHKTHGSSKNIRVDRDLDRQAAAIGTATGEMADTVQIERWPVRDVSWHRLFARETTCQLQTLVLFSLASTVRIRVISANVLFHLTFSF